MKKNSPKKPPIYSRPMNVSGQSSFNHLYYENEVFDKMLHAIVSKYTGWFSPASFGLAYFDWYIHLLFSPAKRMDILKNNLEDFFQEAFYCFESCFKECELNQLECKPSDDRFYYELWKTFPFNLYVQNFLLFEKCWDHATKNVRGVSPHHARVVNFLSRQMLDLLSPSNVPWMNPEIIQETIQENGQNFVRGMFNFFEDYFRQISKLPPVGTEKFKVGKNLAITPGKVIYRNRLIELIQYDPETTEVNKEPILIVPAWIMKYYILDLSASNSMVKYLVDQGHTVFIISWRNPTGEDRDLGFDAYLNLGIMSALDVINQIVPDTKVNAVGYCIGGTLLMVASAAMAGRSDNRFNTVTIFAAQVDFRTSGELLLFMDESQVTYLEDIMWEKGYLDGSQMAGAFSMLRSSELIWSRMVREYLLGKREPIFDLMAWDYDTTRLPYKMHSEYLRKFFISNELIQGSYSVAGKNIALPDITEPIFVVSTLTDHVAPWKSVYKIHLYSKTDITFVLTNGGHNAGIVSEPGHANRKFQMRTTLKSDKHVTADNWQKTAPSFEGSWWPAWDKWLVSFSEGKVNARISGSDPAFSSLCDAPGTYVLKR